VACVYRHIRLDKNQPFYIGIGVHIKRAYSKTHRNKHWQSIVSKTEYRVEILFDEIDYEFAKEKEIEFIAIYGRKEDGGVLCNITKGGDGCLGLKHTEEAKLKMSIPNKGKIISEEQRRRVSEVHKGKKLSEEHKRKLSEVRKGMGLGVKLSEERKQKMRESAKRGEQQKASKLSEKDVIKIRELSKMGFSQRKISKMFNMSKTNIAHIVNRKTWTHI